jgi:hypothetical protein
MILFAALRYHFPLYKFCVIIYVIIFRVLSVMLSFNVIIFHSWQMLSFMLSFDVIVYCYHFPPFFFFLKPWHTRFPFKLRSIVGKLARSVTFWYGSGCRSRTLIHLHHFSKIKKLPRSHMTVVIKVFLAIFAQWWKEPEPHLEPDPYLWLTDPDADPVGLKNIQIWIRICNTACLLCTPHKAFRNYIFFLL